MRKELLTGSPQLPALAPLTPVKPRGWVAWIFWGLRVYIAAMLVLVVIGFSRGLH